MKMYLDCMYVFNFYKDFTRTLTRTNLREIVIQPNDASLDLV